MMLVRQIRHADTPSSTSTAGRVRVRLGPDAGDLAAAQPRERRRQRPAAGALGDATVAIELRRALAQPCAAVRALGYVRADLRSAVLADDEEIWTAGAHDVKCKAVKRAHTPVAAADHAGLSGAAGLRLEEDKFHEPGKGGLHASRISRKALHPGVRPSRLVPEEDVRDRGRPHRRGDRDDRRRQAPDLRGHARGGPDAAPRRARPVCWSTSSSARTSRAVREEAGLRLAMPVEKSGQNEFDFEYGDDFRRAHRAVRPRLLEGARPLQPGRSRRRDEPPPAGEAEAPRRLAARARPQVPVRAARAGHRSAARVGRRQHRTATTRNCARS